MKNEKTDSPSLKQWKGLSMQDSVDQYIFQRYTPCQPKSHVNGLDSLLCAEGKCYLHKDFCQCKATLKRNTFCWWRKLMLLCHHIIHLFKNISTFYNSPFLSRNNAVYCHNDERYTSTRVTTVWNNWLSEIYSTQFSSHWLRLMEFLAQLILIGLINVWAHTQGKLKRSLLCKRVRTHSLTSCQNNRTVGVLLWSLQINTTGCFPVIRMKGITSDGVCAPLGLHAKTCTSHPLKG